MVGTARAALSGRERIAIVVGVALLAVLGAALLVPPPAPGVPAATTESRPVPALHEGVVGRATSVNPLVPRNAADIDLVALVFSGLTRSLPDGNVGPDLAESWTVSPDGKTYTFVLRAGAAWHDGQPVTADDVVFTVLTIQDPGYGGALASSWRAVRAEKIDARTVRFTLAEPVGAFLQATTLPLLPAHRLVGVPVTSLADDIFNRQPVGSGPYRLVRLERDQAVLQLAGASSGAQPGDLLGSWPLDASAGAIPRIVMHFYPDVGALVAAYLAGEIDSAAGLPPEEAFAVGTLPGTDVLRYPTTTLTEVVPNVRPGAAVYRDVHVRRGLLQAIDRDGIVKGNFRGAAERADSPISSASWAFDEASTTVYAFDREAAAKHFAAAGWSRAADGWHTKDDRPVAFSLAAIAADNDPVSDAVARAIIADWEAVGLSVELVQSDPDAFVAQLRSGGFDMALLDVNMGLDPDVFPLLTSSQALEGGTNVGGYQSAELDRLLSAARLAADRTARRTASAALQAALTRDLPILPIVFADEVYVVRATLTGPHARLFADRSGRFWNVLTWRLADGRVPGSAVAR